MGRCSGLAPLGVSLLRMSAIGTKRTSPSALHMSAFGGKADIKIWRRHACFFLSRPRPNAATASPPARPPARARPPAPLPARPRPPARPPLPLCTSSSSVRLSNAPASPTSRRSMISPQTLAFPSDAIAMAEPLRAFFAICRASSSSPYILSRVVSTSRESRALRTAIRTPTKYTGPSHTNPT